MRNFFNSHWKVILAILVAIVLAMLTIESSARAPPLAARLQAHTQALALATPHRNGALRHVDTSLRRYGYVPRLRHGDDAAHPGRGGASVEAALARVAPGQRPDRVFIVGAQLGPDAVVGTAGAAAVLELARAARALRPALSTEIRFVFFMHEHQAADAGPRPDARYRDGGNFMAFVGSRTASAQVRQALAALRSDPLLAREGLAAPAHVMGLTLSGHGAPREGPALVITDAGFLRFPYFRTGTPPGDPQDDIDYEGMARIVDGLGRTLDALASATDI